MRMFYEGIEADLEAQEELVENWIDMNENGRWELKKNAPENMKAVFKKWDEETHNGNAKL